jgi:hypothetical protein
MFLFWGHLAGDISEAEWVTSKEYEYELAILKYG